MIVDELTGAPERGDPTTGEVRIEPAAGCQPCVGFAEQNAGLILDLRKLQQDIGIKNRRIAKLEGEIKGMREQSPEWATVKTIYHRWVERTGRNPKRTKLGAKRGEVILARLHEGYTAADLLHVADALGIAPTTSEPETQRLALIAVMREACSRLGDEAAAELRSLYHKQMANVVTYDDIELGCRNEIQVERLRAIGERMSPGASVPREVS